jgi:hypothetical protein
MKRMFLNKAEAVIVPLLLLSVSVTGALAGDWAAHAPDAKSKNHIQPAARQFAGPAVARTALLKAWARSNGSEAARPTSATKGSGEAAVK